MRLVRWTGAVVAAAALAVVGTGIALRLVPSDPHDWHVDPADIVRPGTSNDFLAATHGHTAADPDLVLPPGRGAPADFLDAVDRIAMAEPGTERLAGSAEEGRLTYVQRSPVFGFPDYITVAAHGSDRAFWSRARFGRDDFGVNQARVERWLRQVGP